MWMKEILRGSKFNNTTELNKLIQNNDQVKGMVFSTKATILKDTFMKATINNECGVWLYMCVCCISENKIYQFWELSRECLLVWLLVHGTDQNRSESFKAWDSLRVKQSSFPPPLVSSNSQASGNMFCRYLYVYIIRLIFVFGSIFQSMWPLSFWT